MKQDTGLSRDTTDKYYTKLEIVEKCKIQIQKHIQITDDDLVIEPSAGNGSFIQIIKELSKNHNFYDIKPENKEIKKQDFLALDTGKIRRRYRKIHVIGNPPFGRQSSLAIKFIKKCCQFADTISFILPRSFKKNSYQAKFDTYFHLVYQKDLPENSFMVNGENFDVPCVFQIWEKRTVERKLPIKLEPKHFKFVDKTTPHDISFRRIGVYAGKIETQTIDKSVQSHYFIKFTNQRSINDNLKLLSKVKFDLNNTVGARSISKQELIKEFNKYL